MLLPVQAVREAAASMNPSSKKPKASAAASTDFSDVAHVAAAASHLVARMLPAQVVRERPRDGAHSAAALAGERAARVSAAHCPSFVIAARRVLRPSDRWSRLPPYRRSCSHHARKQQILSCSFSRIGFPSFFQTAPSIGSSRAPGRLRGFCQRFH